VLGEHRLFIRRKTFDLMNNMGYPAPGERPKQAPLWPFLAVRPVLGEHRLFIRRKTFDLMNNRGYPAPGERPKQAPLWPFLAVRPGWESTGYYSGSIRSNEIPAHTAIPEDFCKLLIYNGLGGAQGVPGRGPGRAWEGPGRPLPPYNGSRTTGSSRCPGVPWRLPSHVYYIISPKMSLRKP
jgi:hypothetical protein